MKKLSEAIAIIFILLSILSFIGLIGLLMTVNQEVGNTMNDALKVAEIVLPIGIILFVTGLIIIKILEFIEYNNKDTIKFHKSKPLI